MKKVLSVFVVLSLLFNILFQQPIFAAADIEKPVIKSVTVDKKSAKVGDTVTYIVEATDNVGVDKVYIDLKKPQTGNNVFERMVSLGNNKYQYQMTVTNSSESGEWKVASVLVYDGTENYVRDYNSTIGYGTKDYSSANVQITGGLADIEKPVIKSVTVDKKSAKVGDTVTYIVEATDNVGVDKVYIDLKKPQTGNNVFERMVSLGNNKYQYQMTVTNSSESGEWKVASVLVYDGAENYVRDYNSTIGYGTKDYSSANVQITGGLADIEKPVIKSVTVDKKSAKVGDTVTYIVEATDNVGVDKVYIDLKKPQTGNNVFERMVSLGNNKYQYQMTVTDNSELGEWKVASVLVYDGAENYVRDYNSTIGYGTKDYSSATVNIGSNIIVEPLTTEKPTTEKPTTEKPTTEKPTTEKPTTEKPTTEKPTTERPTTERPTTEKPTTEKPTTEKPTTEKPTTEKPLDPKKLLKSISVNKQSFKDGEQIKFSAEVLDDSRAKISEIMLNYVDYEKSDVMYLYLHPSDKDTFTLEQEVNDLIKAGKWKVTNITVFYNNGELQNFFNTKAEFGTQYQPYADYSNIDLTVEKTYKPPFIPDGVLNNNSDYERKLHKIKVLKDYQELYSTSYIAYRTTDQAIRDAMTHIDSKSYYYDKTSVSKGYIMFNNGVTSFAGTSSDITIYVKSYRDLNNTVAEPSVEKPTTEKPTTERPTTERPTTEKPTTERPTTEKPTTEKPTTERPTTERPTTERPTTERPTTERPTTERPTTEKPTTEKPTTERPTTEKPTTEKPTTERPTTERPTTERPTTERPTTEKPTTEKPTTERPTTEKPKPTKPTTTQPKPSTTKPTTTKPKPSTTKPTTSKPKPVVVAKPVITNKYISNASAVIGGKGMSNSKVYAVVNNKVIGSAVVKNGKFSFKIAKQKAGTKISFYAYYNKNKSAVVTVKVIDKIAPGLPTVNKVTTKSTSVSGKGERYAKVYVYKGKSKVGYAVVDRKGNFNVKIAKQKKNTTLSIYLVDNAGNKGKYKNIKVS
ncbi:Ig-like domain-containing protein [Macrococcus capreoli]|uniref:Ig-like domain-containing protein n=1 Tax=Macrococcus capreoli TaxID=2982690 RepID=UPI003EE499BE